MRKERYDCQYDPNGNRIYKNPPEVRAAKAAYMREYYARNPEKREKAGSEKRKIRNSQQKEHRNYIREKHPKLFVERNRSFKLKTYFGITLEQFNTLLSEQNGRCASCGTNDPPRTGKPNTLGEYQRWAVDHNHSTGAVRGILCNTCNVAAGMLQDDPQRCRLLGDYLIRTATPVFLGP